MRRYLPFLLAARRRRRWSTVGLALWVCAALYCLLPNENPLVQGVRFNAHRYYNYFAYPASSMERWLDPAASSAASAASAASGRLYDRVGIVIKTGYATRHRVPAQLRALGLRPHAEDAANVVVVGDYTGDVVYSLDDNSTAKIAIHDVIAPMLETNAVRPRIHSVRAIKYRSLVTAVQNLDDAEAERISRAASGELDTMKYLPGIEKAFRVMPDKDWFVLLDDNTYIVPASLRLLVAHLDPAVPHYIGNALGDFRVRFAHRGSGILLSRAAVARLVADRAVVHRGYVESLVATLGDKLLSISLMRVGVNLNERYMRLFNGQRPAATRVSADRFCLPILSFHGLDAAQMADIGARLNGTGEPGDAGSALADAQNDQKKKNSPALVWGDLWALFGRPTTAALRAHPVHDRRDFVGRPGPDSSSAGLYTSELHNVASAETCRALCVGRDVDDAGAAPDPSRLGSGYSAFSNTCLAWSWNVDTHTCTMSPWFVVDDDSTIGYDGGLRPLTVSGIHTSHLQQLINRCSQRSGVAWAETEAGYSLVWGA